MFNIGLHMCGWGKDIPALIKSAKELEYDGIELALEPLEEVYKKDEIDEILKNVNIAPSVFVMWCNFDKPEQLNIGLEKVKKHCNWIKARGGNKLIFGPVEGRENWFSDKDIKSMYENFEKIANAVIQENCVPLYHNHYRFSHNFSKKLFESDIRNINWNKWKLCIDTGHLVLSLQDEVKIVEKYKNIISWMHFKDVKSREFDDLDNSKKQIGKLFTEVGSGIVKFKEILEILNNNKYNDWVVVEQDWTDTTPQNSAMISKRYLDGILR